MQKREGNEDVSEIFREWFKCRMILKMRER